MLGKTVWVYTNPKFLYDPESEPIDEGTVTSIYRSIVENESGIKETVRYEIDFGFFDRNVAIEDVFNTRQDAVCHARADLERIISNLEKTIVSRKLVLAALEQGM